MLRASLPSYESVRDEYEQLLAAERSVDFHDLINGAARLIGQGTWESPFRYVLVDEFQDISAGRMALLKALGSPGVAYFLGWRRLAVDLPVCRQRRPVDAEQSSPPGTRRGATSQSHIPLR